MYKQLIDPITKTLVENILRISDNTCIPPDQNNTDYQAFLKFLADGGQPLPADDNGQTA